MAKEAKKVPSKKKSTPKTPGNPPTVETPVVETSSEGVNASQMTVKNLAGTTGSALDANHRVELLHLADDIFRKDPNAEKRFTLELREGMNSIIAAGVVSALADEAQFGNGTFTAVLQSSMYPQLVTVAHDMGIKLPNIKALPDGTVELPSTDIKPTKEAKQQLEEEHNIQIAGEKGEIELDPVKVAELDEDALVKALKYILVTGPKQKAQIKDTLVQCVEFMSAYRSALVAAGKDTTDYSSYTTYDWLNDAFSHVKPTHLLSGIGLGMRMLADSELGGVSAFCILRTSLTDKETNTPCWDDQSIADATKAIIKWSCEDKIAKDEAGIAALDEKSKTYDVDKKMFEKSIEALKVTIDSVMNPNFDLIDDLKDLITADNKTVVKMVSRLRRMFFPESLDKDASDYKNLYDNIQQKAGVITNMFRNASNTNQNYAESNICDLVEYTEEEKIELRKTEAKAKKEESKNA